MTSSEFVWSDRGSAEPQTKRPAGGGAQGQPAELVTVGLECRKTRQAIPQELLNDLDETSSSLLFRHISRCRHCLEAYIALQAAAELAYSMDDSENGA